MLKFSRVRVEPVVLPLFLEKHTSRGVRNYRTVSIKKMNAGISRCGQTQY